MVSLWVDLGFRVGLDLWGGVVLAWGRAAVGSCKVGSGWGRS